MAFTISGLTYMYMYSIKKLALTWCRFDTIDIKQQRTKGQKNEENNKNNKFVRRCSIVICPASSTLRRSPYTKKTIILLTKICVNTHLSSSVLQVVSDFSDSDRGLSLKGFSFSEANEGFMVAAFSQEVARFHMEVCLESFTGGLATVEPVTLTSIVLIKYEGGELLNNYYSYYHRG